MDVQSIAFAIVALIIGLIVGYIFSKNNIQKELAESNQTAGRIIEKANHEAESLKKEALLGAKEEIQNYRIQVESELSQRRTEVTNQESRLAQREDNLDQKGITLDKRDEAIQKKEEKAENHKRSLDEREASIEGIISEQDSLLQEIASMTRDEAKEKIIEDARIELDYEYAVMVKRHEERVKNDANKISKDILAQAIQRNAADEVADSTLSVIHLPNDDMKGRIIGKDGRNIRTFESLTGMDVIIDDTPETVVLSGFDPLRREIAHNAMQRLIQDGRIHPGRIEEAVEKARRDMDDRLREIGEEAVFELGIHNLHPDLIKSVGRLHFRTSYGQNALIHSKQVAKISGVLAAELGENQNLAKRAGLLHDIGKAHDAEVEGSHVEIGSELALRYKEPAEVIDAIASHHGDVPAKSVIAVLVEAADQISSARPGARSESLESYLQRLTELEEIANSFEGVHHSFAIQAGREVRVMVEPNKVEDANAIRIARDIKNRIENELQYPGHIKVTVIRETRITEVAK